MRCFKCLLISLTLAIPSQSTYQGPIAVLTLHRPFSGKSEAYFSKAQACPSGWPRALNPPPCFGPASVCLLLRAPLPLLHQRRRLSFTWEFRSSNDRVKHRSFGTSGPPIFHAPRKSRELWFLDFPFLVKIFFPSMARIDTNLNFGDNLISSSVIGQQLGITRSVRDRGST